MNVWWICLYTHLYLVHSSVVYESHNGMNDDSLMEISSVGFPLMQHYYEEKLSDLQHHKPFPTGICTNYRY